MDRIFLAVIVSGLLLAATSMLLLVTTGGDTVAELKVPPGASAEKLKTTRGIERDPTPRNTVGR